LYALGPGPAVAPPVEGEEATAASLPQFREQLANKFAPVLYMHPDDPYEPKEVSIMVDNADLKMKSSGALASGQVTLDSLGNVPNSENLYLDLRVGSGPTYSLSVESAEPWNQEYRRIEAGYDTTVYAHVAQLGDKTVLQYWFFYFFNDGYNEHEGDWEMVELVFNTIDWEELTTTAVPTSMAFSRHGRMSNHSWDTLTVVASHPPVYVAKGSHANYAQTGNFVRDVPGPGGELAEWAIENILQLMDVTSYEGKVLATSEDSAFLRALEKITLGRIQPYRIEMLDKAPWLDFAGNWGEWDKSSLKILLNGPEGPACQDMWRGPTTCSQSA